MASPKDQLLRIPTCSVYHVTTDTIELQSAEYADIPADSIARLLAGHFNIPTDEDQPQ